MILFKTKISFLGLNNSGKVKKQKEVYFIQADDLLDLDAILRKYAEGMFDNYEVESVQRTEVDEIVDCPEGGDFFLCSVKSIVYDEETGKESSKRIKILVQERDLEAASKVLHSKMGTSVSDYEVKGIVEIGINDIILK